MIEYKCVVGVWCGAGSELLRKVHEVPLLRLTIKRVGACFCLIPWTTELDFLEPEIRSWHGNVRRCHPDERIAMRDLVVELGADIGAIVHGTCASIDKAEVQLALERLKRGFERYESPRVKARPAVDWLQVMDTEEFVGPLSVEELVRTLPPTALESRIAKLRLRQSS